MKIKVCLPFYSEYETAKSGLSELSQCPDHEFVIKLAQGTYVGAARNFLINNGKSRRQFQELEDYDAYLTIDSDIRFTLEDILTLINHDKDIVALPYQYHLRPEYYVAGYYDAIKHQIIDLPSAMRGFQKVNYVGAGCVLIKKEVFEKTPYPWYRHIPIEFEEDGVKCADEMWEDVGFCMNVKEHGFAIWCDLDNPVEHIDQKQIALRRNKILNLVNNGS